MHPIVTLAANASQGNRRYVCVVGAGLSKDAGLPTAWDLMLRTAEIIRAREQTDPSDNEDTEKWFLGSEYARLPYDQLVGSIYPTSVAQQKFLQDELKLDKPGKGHQLIARLAALRVLRCVITTNFDNQIEAALRDEHLDFQVITEENLQSSEPLIQCSVFRIYKPHGTIGSGRLRNTPEDLRQLAHAMEVELSNVVNDHGLIVLGYSGADESMRRVFRSKRRYLYPTFWVHIGQEPHFEPPLFGNEPLHFVHTTGASAFLGDLIETYRKLDAMAPSGYFGSFARAAEEAIRDEKKGVRSLVSRCWKALADEINRIAPDLSSAADHDAFTTALGLSVSATASFTKVAIAAAEMDDMVAATSLYEGFEHLQKGYCLPRGQGGFTTSVQFDFHKFLGHEWFVTLFACLIREERWETIAELLGQGIYSDDPSLSDTSRLQSFSVMNHHVGMLHNGRSATEPRRSPHWDVLRERHESIELSEHVTTTEFMDADFFLYLASLARTPDRSDPFTIWDPWSTPYLSQTPRFLLAASKTITANRLCSAIGLSTVDELRQLLSEAQSKYVGWKNSRGILFSHTPLSRFDPRQLATR